jgi:hypothetical protein
MKSRVAENQVAELLRKLAGEVRTLTPSHRDPEAFHERKSEIVAELRRLAMEVQHG